MLAADTTLGRVARGTLGLLRCCNPVASRRADLGEALVRFGRPYPYGWWLRVQRVRRTAAAGGPGEAKPPAVAVAESDLPRGSWEPDGLELLGRAVAGGAEVVQFHDDAPAEDGSSEREVFIRPTLGPVGRRSDAPGGGALLGSPDPLGSARSVRIDEVLLHRSERPPAQVVSAPSASGADMAVVIPSPGNTRLLERVFAGLEREPNVVEVVVVDNTLPSPAMEELQREWSGRINLQVVRTDPEAQFNYSRANNVGADATTAPVLAFCNDDLEFIEHPTLARLAGWLEVPGIGVVGPQLRYPDGTIQHGGVVIGLNGLAEHAFAHMSPNTDTLIGNTDDPRDVSAVTGACLVTTREVLDLVGGFDEELVLTGSDVWFCLRAAELGFSTAYDGTVALVHHESVARGDTNHLDDVLGSARRWGSIIDAGDPYWSARLACHRHVPTLRRPSDPTSRQMLETYLRSRGVHETVVAGLRAGGSAHARRPAGPDGAESDPRGPGVP